MMVSFLSLLWGFVFFSIAFFSPLTSSSELMKMYVNKDGCDGCVGAGVKVLLLLLEATLCLVCRPLQASHRGCSAVNVRPEASVGRQ